jgi:hypothetical protein
MSALPVLVAWGAVISKLVVVGIPTGTLAAWHAIRRARDLKPARADVARMGLAINEPREGPIAVRGTYRREAGAEPWLDCSGQRVVLDGAVVIVRGTAATWKRRVRTYTVRDGDDVIAIGRMSRAASGDATDYREAAGGWRLAPSTGEPAIQLCTARPVACPKPLWPVRGVLVLGLVGLASYYGLGYYGNAIVKLRDYPRSSVVGDDDVSTSSAELASALPRSRERALNRLAIDLQYRPQTDDVIAERMALARMIDCEGAIALAKRLDRFDEAVELARDCDLPLLARTPLVALGRYDEAARIPATMTNGDDADVGDLAAIGAGKWREAAALNTGDRPSVRCFAQYLRSRAGDPIGDLEVADPTCRVIAGTLAPRDDRGAYFPEPHDYEPGLSTVRWAFAGATTEYGYDDALAPWLAPFAVDQDSAVTHARRAELELDLGHADAATRELGRVEAIDQEWGRRLGYVVALRTGKPIPPFEPATEISGRLEDAIAIRGGAPVHESVMHLDMRPPACTTMAVRALDEAAAGDGLVLAHLFEHCIDVPAMSIDPLYLFAVAPSVTKHREELAIALRNWPLDGGLPFGQVHAFAIKRDLARLLGDDAEATRLQAIVDRHAKVLGDRDRVTAIFLDQLHF